MTADFITKEEAQVFAEKLDAFGQALTPKEQALLRDILVRAASTRQDDVQGHNMAQWLNQDSEPTHANLMGYQIGPVNPNLYHDTPTIQPPPASQPDYTFTLYVMDACGYPAGR